MNKHKVFAFIVIIFFLSFSLFARTLTFSKLGLKEGERINFDLQNNETRLYGALRLDYNNFQVLFPETLQFTSKNLYFGQFNPSGTFRLLFYPMDINLEESSGLKIFSPSVKLSGSKKLTGLIFSPTDHLSFLKTGPIFGSTSLNSIGIFYNSKPFYINDFLIFNPPKSSKDPYCIDWDVFSFQKTINFFIIGGKINEEFFSSSWYLQNTYKKNSSIFLNYSFSLSLFLKDMSFTYTKKLGQNINEPLLTNNKLFPSIINKFSYFSQTHEKVDFEINYSISEYPGPKISGKSQRRIYFTQFIISQQNFSYTKSIKNEFSEKREQIRTTSQLIKFELPTKRFSTKFSIEIKNMKNFNLKFSTSNLNIDYQIEKSKLQATLKHTFSKNDKTLTISFDQDQVVTLNFKMFF